MDDDFDEEDETVECTYEEAKETLQDYVSAVKDFRECDEKEFAWIFKKGREPDVVGYLFLAYDARLKIVH